LRRKENLLGGILGEEVEHLEDHKSCNYYKKNQSLFVKVHSQEVSSVLMRERLRFLNAVMREKNKSFKLPKEEN